MMLNMSDILNTSIPYDASDLLHLGKPAQGTRVVVAMSGGGSIALWWLLC